MSWEDFKSTMEGTMAAFKAVVTWLKLGLRSKSRPLGILYFHVTYSYDISPFFSFRSLSLSLFFKHTSGSSLSRHGGTSTIFSGLYRVCRRSSFYLTGVQKKRVTMIKKCLDKIVMKFRNVWKTVNVCENEFPKFSSSICLLFRVCKLG